MKKTIFVDIDGTLTRNNGIISNGTKRVLKKYKNIIPTTGRPRDYVRNLCEELNLRYFICSYGSEIYDIYEEKTIYNATINTKAIKTIAKLCFKYDCLMYVVTEGKNILVTKDNYLKLSKNVKQGMIKGHIKNLNNVRKAIDNIDGIKYHRDNLYEKGYFWFGINPKETSKGNAADILMKYLNINKKDTISIGNDVDDISLFMKTENKIAVADSCEELKNMATIIIGDNNKDSVKKYIQSISL